MFFRLYDWAPSPFSLKVRAILEYKGIAYERASVLQVKNLLALRRGGVGKAPALEIDGRLVVDSTSIAYEVEKHVHAPSIFPTDAHQRALCHALEEWADESLYFMGLYFHWHDPEGRQAVPVAFGRSLAGRALFRFYLRRVLRQLQGQGTSRKSPKHVREDSVRQLQAIEELTRGPGFLLGGEPYLCDFALFGQLVYFGRSPVGARLLAQYDGIAAYVDRMKSLKGAHPATAQAASGRIPMPE